MNTGRVDAKKRPVFTDGKKKYVMNGTRKIYVQKTFTPPSAKENSGIFKLFSRFFRKKSEEEMKKQEALKQEALRKKEALKQEALRKQEALKQEALRKQEAIKKQESLKQEAIKRQEALNKKILKRRENNLQKSPVANTGKINSKHRSVLKDTKGRRYVMEGPKKIYVKSTWKLVNKTNKPYETNERMIDKDSKTSSKTKTTSIKKDNQETTTAKTNVKKSTKDWERLFVNNLNKHFDVPKDVILKDKFGNTSNVIPNIYGARVLTDKRALSPYITRPAERNRIITSKADISLFTKEDGKRVDVAWLSHKKGYKNGKPEYMQYLDVSSNVNFTTQKDAENEIKSFKNKMFIIARRREKNSDYCWPRYSYKKGNKDVSMRVWDNVKTDSLKNMAIFGVDYYEKTFGRNNVNAFFVGNPVIEKTSSTLTISASDMSLLNGHVNLLPPANQPIFFVKPTRAAKTIMNSKIIKGASVWIIYRSYASANNKKIDEVIQSRNLIGTC